MKEHILVCLAPDLKQWKSVRFSGTILILKLQSYSVLLEQNLPFMRNCFENVAATNENTGKAM